MQNVSVRFQTRHKAVVCCEHFPVDCCFKNWHALTRRYLAVASLKPNIGQDSTIRTKNANVRTDTPSVWWNELYNADKLQR